MASGWRMAALWVGCGLLCAQAPPREVGLGRQESCTQERKEAVRASS